MCVGIGWLNTSRSPSTPQTTTTITHRIERHGVDHLLVAGKAPDDTPGAHVPEEEDLVAPHGREAGAVLRHGHVADLFVLCFVWFVCIC